MSKLLMQQYKKIDDKDYKFELLTLAFETDKLMERSLYFIDSTVKIPFPVLLDKRLLKKPKTNIHFLQKRSVKNIS